MCNKISTGVRIKAFAAAKMPLGIAANLSASIAWAQVPDTADAPAAVATAVLPRDLSPLGMFMNADIVVKAIMIGLLIASLVTWTVWVAKTIELRFAKNKARAAMRVLEKANSLAEADRRIGDNDDAVARLVRTASAEAKLSNDTTSAEALKERISWLLERIQIAAGRRVGRGMGIIATVGATAPFVGLLGTVWGIMNSFIGISNAHTTNLAVVAPGIAEALLATALGLFAAIPAVVIYNAFTRSIGSYRALIADAGVLVMRLVSRDSERHHGFAARAAE
ncbi:MAG: biopolymer transport protein ExbB [Alphaproteobacteria bacterium]|jgi:biopolymer transport protein ExbB|nr:biopolymer transport protein ExbB [Alphaproteobacteria bacterium]